MVDIVPGCTPTASNSKLFWLDKEMALLATADSPLLFENRKGTGMTSKKAQDRFLKEAGVATTVAGTSFGAWGKGYLRFSYANSIENILKAVHRIRDIL